MLIGLLLAATAAICTGVASIWQAIAVRRAGAAGGTASDLIALRSQPIYFAGLALDFLGFLGIVGALQYLPLFLAQSVIASSVGVTAVIAAFLGARIGRTGWVSLAALGCGLVLLALAAAPEGVSVLTSPWAWALLAGVLPIAALGSGGARLSGRIAPAVLALAAGLGFALMSISARTLVVPDPWWRLVSDPTAWAVVVNGVAGTALFAMALQAGVVTVVSAITFATEIVLPAGVGLLWLGDATRPGFAAAAAAGFLLAVAGVVALARYSDPVLPGATPTDRP